ncbi:hypothetical protein LguiB_019312 [Lonicera macranthoides]
MVRINLGLRKIAMKNISSRKDLQVAFLKRRCSLFKKASELCIFNGGLKSLLSSSCRGSSGDAISSLYQQHKKLHNRLEAEKKRGEEFKGY